MQNLKFLALVVVKIYDVTLSIGFSRRFSPKSGLWGIKGGLLTLVNLSTERSLQYYISDPRSKFQEDRTKIVVAIVDETFCGHTDKHTDKHSSDFISVQCHELHWTDKKYDDDDDDVSSAVPEILAVADYPRM